MSASLTFDPFDAAQTQHMWDRMREFRDRAPVARIGGGFVYVSRYADVQTVLRDQETFSNGGGMRPTGVEIPLLWWLDKLTTLQLQFSPIPVAGLRHYVEKHLAKAGWAGGELFTHDAIEAIHHYTGGVPRAINELCEKILMEGGARGINSISANFIEQLCDVPATDSANPDSGSASDFSSDFSIGDFGTGPSAQELLDAEVPEETNQPEVRIAPDADFMAKQPEDLQSLILTQDSAEELRVEPEPDLKGQPSVTIELEDDPIERMREQEAFLVRSASRSRVDMKRIPSGYHAPKRHGGRVTFALIIAGIGYAVYSQFALPTQIIDEAEVKIIKALKRQPPTQPTEQAEEQPEAIEEIEEEPILPRSLLDRADELAAETGLDKIPLPSLDEMVADPTEELSQAEKVGNSDLQGLESGEITPSEFATPVSEDIVVLNEYTAIPEAASTAPKPSIPGTEKIKPDSPRSRAATTEKTAKRVFPQQGGHPKPKASETDTKPPMPAKIDAEPSANSTKPLPAVQLPAAIDTNPKEIEEEAVVPTPEPETTEADLLSTTPIWL